MPSSYRNKRFVHYQFTMIQYTFCYTYVEQIIYLLIDYAIECNTCTAISRLHHTIVKKTCIYCTNSGTYFC